MTLMEAIEKERPKIRWNAGQRPTEYSPPIFDFPIKICLDDCWSNNSKLSYRRVYR